MNLFLLACSGTQSPSELSAAPIFVENPKVASGEALVLHVPLDTTLPTVEGLSASPDGVDAEGRGIWKLTGKDGSYILTFPGKDAQSPPVAQLYVDLGVSGPSAGQIQDLAAVPPPPPPIWPYVAVALLASLLVILAGIWAFQRFKPKPAPKPPEPAWMRARREWEALRQRKDMEPEAMALALSSVYRRYLEADHGWPATSRTSNEILDNLAGELTAAQLACARRLLMAMDLVKFAEREGHTHFFESLDDDFHALVRSHA